MAYYNGPDPNSEFYNESDTRCARLFLDFGVFHFKENNRDVYDAHPQHIPNQPIPIPEARSPLI